MDELRRAADALQSIAYGLQIEYELAVSAQREVPDTDKEREQCSADADKLRALAQGLESLGAAEESGKHTQALFLLRLLLGL